MASSFKSLRLLLALGVAACVSTAAAQAQWLPPFGAAPPHEIAQRLRAEGYVLLGPLYRNQTVYLVDVDAGPAGRERLVIDAWSGEVLQRFLIRRRHPGRRGGSPEYYVTQGGGDFGGPPPLGPPPVREFFAPPGGSGGYAYGEPPGARVPSDIGPVYPPPETPRRRIRQRPASAPHTPESKPATASAPAETTPAAGANANPAPTGTASAPSNGSAAPLETSQPTNASAKPDTSATGASPEPSKNAVPTAAPPSGSSAPVETQAKNASPAPAVAPPTPAPAALEKPGDKSKVNDVPVNPLN